QAALALAVVAGPRPPEFPALASPNQALRFGGTGHYLAVDDPGASSALDFAQGDSLTIEAWIQPGPMKSGQFGYIVGKGRTGRPGMPADNQNYALRVQALGGGAGLSFLFRSAGPKPGWHRWTSGAEIAIGDGWHHVAVSYTFGDPQSIRGYVDGRPVKGKWDMDGPTDQPPVVDDDQLWIGSSMGGQAASSFQGELDEVAIYRQALTAERIQARFRYVPPPLELDVAELPERGVRVQIFEGLPDRTSWEFRPPRQTDSYEAPGFAFLGVPKKYSSRGIHVDRSSPFLLRASGRVTLPPGPQRLLVRCRNASRVLLDGRQVLATDFHRISGEAHGKVFELDASLAPNIRPLRRGDTQSVVAIEGDGQPHLIVFEMIVGGRDHRPDLGETGLFVAPPDDDFRLLSDQLDVRLTRDEWPGYLFEHRQWLLDLDAGRRQQAGAEETAYWQWRHELARQQAAAWPPVVVPELPAGMPAHNAIDHYVAARLAQAGADPTEPVDDLAFLRRLSLDTIGLVPTEQQIEQFLADPAQRRRELAIERLLNDPGWADHWVGYWQDVLAENPNIINPTLNNTGPFRWWIHESWLDNRPLDRFVTELVRMEGSEYYGGPAGFGVATQNDLPMAAKAHILGQAFLGLNMKCARCHDAPFHDYTQEDLFSLAAMLKRAPETVPATSSVPGAADGTRSLLISVSLKPGDKIAPQWSFSELMPERIPDGVLRGEPDTRERLAALITLPDNRRFAQVLVNRLWQRYLGRGLVEPVDDWQDAQPTHPELLDYLARELVTHNYDAKHIARLIFQSHLYQRQPRAAEAGEPDLLAGPWPRRMSAEQLVDSLFVVSGKPFDAGPMNIDIDGARSYKSSLDLGVPTRSWHFASLSNERDRPSLALPFAQPFVTLLETFGWRSSRQDPLTRQAEEPNPLQPAILANGVLGRRTATLSDNSGLARLALEDLPLERLVERVFLRILSRLPSESERAIYVELLEPGFAERRTGQPPLPQPRLRRDLVGWSNHLDPEANVIKKELEAHVQQGDPPTPQLAADWRERMEDMVWTLVNSPEFIHVP
ncbi:MAG: DUF1553 domain-containing protein, partial [Pirellulaceae bacterium]|nr:DUF1553 domain-containing protein [Pirellulaceae bacterium]